ncbi:MAG: hypothetical protein J5809_02695 [Selenomonadaceae bacterium]|nr:hypothetical protein [Selenomonadaceae bacterium]
MKNRHSVKGWLWRLVFPNTPEELRDSAAVVVKLGILSAVIAGALASIGA